MTVSDFLGLMYCEFEDSSYLVFVDAEDLSRSRPFASADDIGAAAPCYLGMPVSAWNARLIRGGLVAIEIYV